MTFIAIILCYLAQGLTHGNWWTAKKICSFAILIIIVPGIVWFLFVPRLLEFSETEITITTLWRKHTYPWQELLAYNGHRGNGFWALYQIFFDSDDTPHNIFLGAYSEEDVLKLNNFIITRFPKQAAASMLWNGPNKDA